MGTKLQKENSYSTQKRGTQLYDESDDDEEPGVLKSSVTAPPKYPKSSNMHQLNDESDDDAELDYPTQRIDTMQSQSASSDHADIDHTKPATYSGLLNMGFSKDLALEAALKHPNILNNAMNYALSKKGRR